MSADTLCWTDIPVTNLGRAIKFYSAVLGKEVKKLSEGGMEYGLLPHEEQKRRWQKSTPGQGRTSRYRAERRSQTGGVCEARTTAPRREVRKITRNSRQTEGIGVPPTRQPRKSRRAQLAPRGSAQGKIV